MSWAGKLNYIDGERLNRSSRITRLNEACRDVRTSTLRKTVASWTASNGSIVSSVVAVPMIIVASSSTTEALSDIDVAIIGSGAAGVALALRLAGRVGKIALVEAGGPRSEPRRQKQFFKEDNLADARHPSTQLYRRRMLGGTTSVWGGRCIPLDREDIEASGHSPGWPIGYDEVARWTADALQILQAGENDFSADALPPTARSPLVDEINDPDILLNRIERFSEPTDVWRKWGRDLVKSEKVVVLRGAACTNIRTTPDGNRVIGVDLRTETGEHLKLTAGKVVLACGGLETTRLLLASRDARSCGLGNEGDLVGRFYMTHLGGTAGAIRLRGPGVDRSFDYGVSPDGIYIRRLIRLTPEARQREKIGNIVFRPNIHSIVDPSHEDAVLSAMAFAKKLVLPEYSRKLVLGASKVGSPAQELVLHGRNILTGMPRLFGFGFDWMRRRTFARRKLPSVFLLRPDSTYPIAFDSEQSPDFNSRVALGNSTDPFGVPRLAIHWRINDADVAGIKRGYEVLKRATQRTGFGEVDFQSDFDERLRDFMGPVGGHHMGTTRMGANPQDSVTDKHGEIWNTKGLFVAGSALFPAVGFANPTLTIVALAVRLADHLARNR
jgi:choline dehydrogenase-like flavoprotein